jgi:hypothetical protein
MECAAAFSAIAAFSAAVTHTFTGVDSRAEKFRQQLQKELGLTVGPKDPILAEWLAHEEFREEMAAEHQRLLTAFEEALAKNQASWSESAKNLANQSLNAALGAAREKLAAFSEEAGRRGPRGGGTRRRTP